MYCEYILSTEPLRWLGQKTLIAINCTCQIQGCLLQCFLTTRILFSQKDVGYKEMVEFKLIYLAPVILESL